MQDANIFRNLHFHKDTYTYVSKRMRKKRTQKRNKEMVPRVISVLTSTNRKYIYRNDLAISTNFILWQITFERDQRHQETKMSQRTYAYLQQQVTGRWLTVIINYLLNAVLMKCMKSYNLTTNKTPKAAGSVAMLNSNRRPTHFLNMCISVCRNVRGIYVVLILCRWPI